MSYDYQTNYTGSPISNNTEYPQVGTPCSVTSHAVSYVSYVPTLPLNGTIYTPVNVNNTVQVVSPLMSNLFYFGSSSTPYNLDGNYLSFEPRNQLVVTPDTSINVTPDTSINVTPDTSVNVITPSNELANKYTLVGYNKSPTTKPSGRDNKAGWYDLHEKHVLIASRRQATVVLCGDSIIAGLSRYSMVWNKHFRPLNAVNCGIGGDRTQHVLWRMENMKLPATVKYIVIHCGTNNIDRDSAQEIANGVVSCGLVLQEHNPELNVVVTGLLPRDLSISRRRGKIIETNKYLKHYCKQFSRFSFMKQDKDWVLENGLLNEQFYYNDHLHLVESGNDKFATSIINVINRLSRNEEIGYSSDEEVNTPFKRVQGEVRSSTPSSEVADQSPLEVTPEATKKKKRKRNSSSLDLVNEGSGSHKRKKTDVDLSPQELVKPHDCSADVCDTPKKCNDNHKLKKTSRKDYFSLTDDVGNEGEDLGAKKIVDGSDNQIKETVEPREIVLPADNEQEIGPSKLNDNIIQESSSSSLKAKSELSKLHIRKKSKTSFPSALVLKIKRSMEQARIELSKKKLEVSLKGYDSHKDPSQCVSVSPSTGMKKLISDYGSGSDSE